MPVRVAVKEEKPPGVRIDAPVKIVAPMMPKDALVAMESVLLAEVTTVIPEAEGDAVRTGRRIGKPDHGGGGEGEGEGPESHDDLPRLKGSSQALSYRGQAEPGMNS
jgi:hypothetical protein